MESFLRREGFVVKLVADGREALLLLSEHQFDVIILDLMMPHMTGDAVIRHLESQQPHLLSRVIVTTAAINRSRELQAHAVGAVVTKPFDLHDFANTVRSVALGNKERAT